MTARSRSVQGFTLAELMVAVAVGAVVLGIVLTASTALQKSFNAVDNYFYTHLQQIRIIDYLSRDVKRAYIVHTSADLQTITCTIPNYIIQSGDPDYTAATALHRRAPTVQITNTGLVVNYGTSTSSVVYSISGKEIRRTENGGVTTIASSTDQLVPQALAVNLANTQYTSNSVTFQPIFTNGNAAAERSGTTVYATAYLRNLRRGN